MKLLKQFSIWHALRKPALADFSSDDENLDCKAVFAFFARDEQRKYRILGILPSHYRALCIRDYETAYECCINFNATDDMNIRVRHWYGGTMSTYDSAFEYIYGTASLYSVRKKLVTGMRQKSYNRNLKIRDDSTQILQILVDEHLRRKSQIDLPFLDGVKFSRFELISVVYGDMIYGYPRHKEFDARLDLIIDSLVASNDLIENNNYVSVSGKALSTISSRVSEDRKHRDHMKHNSAISWLTFALVVVGAIQIFATFSSK